MLGAAMAPGELVKRYSAWLLLAGAALAALAFPTTGAGGIGMLVLVGALGVAAVDHGHRLPAAIRRPSPAMSATIATGVVLVGAAVVFGRILHDRIGWTMGDWGIQHSVLRDVIHGLHDGHLPTWTHALSTGDAPLDTYPALTYLVAGVGAIATGAEDQLPMFLLAFAVVVHTLVAIGITRVSLRVAPAPVAAVVGLTQLVDAGGISAGGVAGDVEWALVHNALGQAFFLLAIVAVMNAIRRPRLRTSVAIWVWTALAAATHPSALLTAGAGMIALVAVAVIATDIPARRSLVAAGHLAFGLALAAVVWMPLGERLIQYGQHFPSAPRSPSDLLTGLLTWPAPATTFAPLMYLGYLGLVAGVLSRRALPVLIGMMGVLLLLGLVDAPYLIFDAGPSRALARLGAERFQSLCRPFVAAGAAYVIALGVRAAARRWRGASAGRRRVLGAVIAIASGLAVRACLPYAADRAATAAAEAERAADDHGEAELRAWARAQAAAIPPDRYARVLFDLGDVHYNYHLTAETGLPSFHMGATPNLLLRERMEDTSADSLRRFDVRWVVIADSDAPRTDGVTLEDWEHPDPHSTAATLALGDPATEQRFGRYVVREVPGWDGAFARIERGAGEVKVVRLDAERVEVELTGTDQPALVALGIGYYPRWRAHDGAGRPVTVYAMPSIPGGELRVVSAWLRPGRAVFTCDGALPSDGAGRGIAGLAALAAIAGIVVWSRRRWRVRILRRTARALAWLERHRRTVLGGAAVAVAVVLPLAGAVRACAPARGLEVGVGLRGVAKVQARDVGGTWEDCGYSRIEGRYSCPGVATVSDVVAGVVNDVQPMWPFTAPAIHIEPGSGASAEVRIDLDARLDGTYWLGARGGVALVQLDDDPVMEIASQRELGLTGRGETRVRIEAVVRGEGTRVAFLRRDAIEPDRAFLVAPPETAPP